MSNSTIFNPDGSLQEQTIDHGTGWGTRTVYEAGEVVSTEQVPMEKPPPVEPTPNPHLRKPLPKLEL